MRKNRRSILLIIFSLIFVLGLYGCGSSEDNDQPNNQQDQDNNDNDADVDLVTIFKDLEYPNNISYDMTVQSQESASYTSSLWIMDDKMRSESELEGQVFISIYDGESFITLDPDTKIAMRYPTDNEASEDDTFDDEPGLGDFLVEDDWGRLTYIEEETLNGVKTYVVMDTFADLDIEYKMWIHHIYGIPMRVESSGPNPDDNYVLEVSNLKIGEVTDADFEIPEDYELMDFGF